jgi:hypothetical protein
VLMFDYLRIVEAGIWVKPTVLRETPYSNVKRLA